MMAVYSGDSTFGSSTSSSITVQIVQASSSTTLAVAPNPSASGQSVSLTATVTPAPPSSGTPTGSVQFFDGTTSLGTATLSGNTATLTTSSLPVGTSSLTASYQGDTNFIASISTAVTANVVEASTTVAVTSSLGNPSAGQLDVLTATITPSNSSATPTGTVTFFANGTAIGSATPSSGKATLSTYDLPVGTASVIAVYAGDANTLASASPILPVSVGTVYEQYVNQVYIDVTGRPADTGGLEYWAAKLQQGGTFNQVLRGILKGAESQAYQVQSTNVKLLGKQATARRKCRLRLGQPNNSIVKISAQILGSPPYFKTRGGATKAGYLTALGPDTVGTSFTTGQEAAINASVASGKTLTGVSTQLLNSTPGTQNRVQTLYQQILSRKADTKGLKFYASLLKQGHKDGQVEIQLLASNEFFQNFTKASP